MLANLNSFALMMFNRGGLRDRLTDGRNFNGCWTLMRQGHPGIMIIGLILTIAFLAGLVILIVSLVRHSGKHHDYSQYKTGTAAAGPSAGIETPADKTVLRENAAALRILDERYARGEIDEEEYLKRKENLLKG